MSIDITNSPPISQNGKAPVATHTVYLALGSNMGDRRGNLAAALQRLRSEEHTSELQSHSDLVCRLLLEKKKQDHRHPGKHPHRIAWVRSTRSETCCDS